MKGKLIVFSLFCFVLPLTTLSQVDTTYIYDTSTPYGGLDIRVAKSPTDYYYLQENVTFSFRESAPGVKTNTYRDMTAWDSSPYKGGNLREKTDAGDNFIMNYRLLIPQSYDPNFKDGFPIIILFHGFGERGNCEDDLCYHATRDYSPISNSPPAPATVDHELLNNDHNLLHGGRQHLDAVNKAGSKLPGDATLDSRAFPGFVLFPQNLNGWDQFAVQDALRILRLLIKKYNIDEDRVYVEGLSNGGHGLYEAIKRAPWLFAAAIPMSAIDDGFINAHGMASATAHIPLWIFQGGYDVNPLPSKTKRYIQQFTSAGASVRYTLYPELGHGTWNKAFGEPEFFSWLLGTNKADIHSFEGSTVICSAEGTRLELARGFRGYQWQFNGGTIAGADSAVFYAKTPGKYRARFSRVSNPSEADWNQWSDEITLTVADPPVANVSQRGTVLLKDLNGNANAVLESPEKHSHYYWYKDGTLLNLPGQEDDTIQVATIAPSYGNGAYTLTVRDQGCTSDPSVAKYVFFNDAAPINIADPANFAGVSPSASENTLTWRDASTNEGGFEIWRRKKLNDTQFTPWEMAGLTAPNATTFDDQGVDPKGVYQYKIRAVSNTGRSNYVPGPVNEGIVVETVVDSEPPQAPADLKATMRGVQKVFLTWKPSKDNTRIREYYIRYNEDSIATGSADTTFVLSGLAANKVYEIRVRGVDLSRNVSPASEAVRISTWLSGLYYEHTTGSWTDLDSIDWSWAEFRGIVQTFTLKPKTQDDYFNFKFEGYLYIENGGTYQFRTSSNDGSSLRLDNKLLVDNDGIHDYQTVTSAGTSLEKGAHPIRVEFFDYIEEDSLLVEYSGPDTGNKWTTMTRDVLKSAEHVVGVGTDPDNGPEDSFDVSVYPNPATEDHLNVLVETVMPAPVEIRLLDPLGRNLFDGVFQPGEISQGVRISPNGRMDNGLYVVTVTQGKTRVQRKVVVR